MMRRGGTRSVGAHHAPEMTERKTPPPLWVVAALTAALTGCGTVPTPYIPRTIGALRNAQITDGLQVTLQPASEIAHRGELFVLHVTLSNVCDRAFWIPRSPDVVLMWIYPNGTHDNFLLDRPTERYYTRDDVIRLAPGEGWTVDVPLRTYYFPMNGITEFRALVRAARNTNPAFAPFWHGKVLSNAYGVLVQGRRRGRHER